MHRFRLLRDNSDKDPIANWDEDVELESIKCPVSPGHQRSGRRFGALRITLEPGPLPDLVWTWGSGLLVTDLVRDLFQDNHLTGFNLLPAHARWQIRGLEHTPCCNHLRYSGITHPTFLIDESQWDGTDFFMIWPLPLFHFVSDRAARIIVEHELTGAVLLDLDEMRPNDGFSPGRLSYWMPEDRARLLGEPLGIF